MTSQISRSWAAINKILSTINAFLTGLFMGRIMDLKQAQERKIPVGWNILLLLIILFLAFIMIYGEYRRVTD
jgi:ABC-type uncharacterized transport system permease subunit